MLLVWSHTVNWDLILSLNERMNFLFMKQSNGDLFLQNGTSESLTISLLELKEQNTTDGWLKWQKFIVSYSQMPEVHSQGISRIVSFWGLWRTTLFPASLLSACLPSSHLCRYHSHDPFSKSEIYLYFFNLWPHPAACGILVPRPRIEPVLPVLGVQS